MRSKVARFGGPLCFAAALCLSGCGVTAVKNVSKEDNAPAKQTGPEPVRETGAMFEIKGDGGTLALNNNLEEAKRIFPMPAGAKPMQQSAIDPRQQKDWGWETAKKVFDAVEQNGKLIFFYVNEKALDANERKQAVQQEIKQFGAPAKQAGNKTAHAYLWKRGECVRLVINLDSKKEPGFLRLVGVEKGLENLGVQANSLDKLVSGFEEPTPMQKNTNPKNTKKK